jgi:excisionase family DNA binding protein
VNDYLTTDEVAAELGIGVDAVLKRVSRRHLQPHRKIGRSYLWTRAHLNAIAADLPPKENTSDHD